VTAVSVRGGRGFDAVVRCRSSAEALQRHASARCGKARRGSGRCGAGTSGRDGRDAGCQPGRENCLRGGNAARGRAFHRIRYGTVARCALANPDFSRAFTSH